MALFLLAGPALAQSADGPDADAELLPAPDWFVEAIVNLTTAQRLAQFCPAVDIDTTLVQSASSDTMARLMSEGFDVTRTDGGMLPSREKFDSRQQAFLKRHGMDSGELTEDLICAAARVEIAEGSGIGAYLTEAEG